MHRTLFGSLLAAGSVAALVCAAPARAQASDEFQFSLPAQNLSTALREVSVRTGRNIIAPADLVRGRQAPPLSGSFTVEGAVRMLLTDSGLDARAVGDSLVIFRSNAGEALTESAESDEATAEGETIVVTGTNIRGARPTSPTIVISREDIDRSGATSVEQLMRQVPQNFQGGVNQENFRVVGAGADPTENGSGVNLRGLGQRGTLVLVNGRRLAPSGSGSFVDVSLLPLSAVERVEILTDGASAIYGSDAVGGVVNFILRDRFEGVETLVQAGTATEGDGDQLQLGATAGAGWRNGRAMLSYEYRLEDEIIAADRDFTINIAPDTALFPRERRHSLFGIINQELAAGLVLEITGLHSQRDSERSYFLLNTPLPVFAVADARTSSATANLSYNLGGDWLVQLYGSYALSDTEQSQRQPGAALELINVFNARTELVEYGLKVDGQLFTLPGGPVRVALGAQQRHEDYRDVFGTGTLAPTERREERYVRSLFGEIYLPLFSSLNRTSGLERLAFTAALRVEDYEGLGSTVDPKIGVLWSPLRGLTFRTSYGTSFRAPLLSETAGAYNAFYFPAALVSVVPAPPGEVALVLAGTNPDIQPERSRSWTLGAELRPPSIPSLSLAINYYSIRFSNRIALPAPTVAVVGDPAYEAIVTRSPAVARVTELVNGAVLIRDVSGPGFTNGGATPADVDLIVYGRVSNTAVTTTDGLDFSLRYSFPIGANQFEASLNANYILNFEEQLNATSPVIDGLDRPFRPVDFRARAGLAWTRNGWSANLFVNHVGGYRDDRGSVDRRVDSWTTLDAGASYTFGDDRPGWLTGTRLAVHLQNAFDTDPPLLLPDPGFTSGLGYDPVNASGRGRTISVQLRRRW